MQAQQKNTVTRKSIPGKHGDEVSTLVLDVDKNGVVQNVEPRAISHLPDWDIPHPTGDPNDVLRGDGVFGPATANMSLLDIIIIIEEGGLVYNCDLDGQNFAFLVKEPSA